MKYIIVTKTNYSQFQRLLEKNKVTAYKVAKATGISTVTLSAWKRDEYIPKVDKLQKIADFFNVDVSYFLNTGETKEVFPDTLIKLRRKLGYLSQEFLIQHNEEFRTPATWINEQELECYEKGILEPKLNYIQQFASILNVKMEALTDTAGIDWFFGKLLKQKRIENQNSKEQLSDYLRVGVRLIDDWEHGHGEISIQQFKRILEKYKIHPDYRSHYIFIDHVCGKLFSHYRGASNPQDIAKRLNWNKDKIGLVEQGNYFIPYHEYQLLCEIYGLPSSFAENPFMNPSLIQINQYCYLLSEEDQNKALNFIRRLANGGKFEDCN